MTSDQPLTDAQIRPAPTMALNSHGKWVPAIPLPFYGLHKRCDCGRRFWTERGYRGHYALVHIVGLS